ncbi:hypothetical protein ACFQZU_09415, partial [Streptomonospora algeriensis]
RDDGRGSLRPLSGDGASGASGDGGASFVDDLSAFSVGTSGTGHDTAAPARGRTDDEEES